MKNEIHQIIYMHGNEEQPNHKTNSTIWSLDKLQKCIASAARINEYYLDKKNINAFLFTDSATPRLRNEQWRKCKSYSYHNHEIYASSYGRIKVKINGKDTICELYEEISPETKIDYAHFEYLIKHSEKHIGWLKARIPDNKCCLGPYVYQLVADAWLDNEYKKGTEIHHITNDGYDNSPENLIILSKEEHDKIRHYGNPDNKYYIRKYNHKS